MTSPDQQPRIPGVKYRQVKRTRQETTVIAGIPSTRDVEYLAWEPVPPRDWDDVMLRVVTGATALGTALTVAGSVAAIGGLLTMMVPIGVAYSVAGAFDLTWLGATAIQWVERDRPERAKRAEKGARAALVLTMAAIVTYGIVLHHWPVGAVAAAVPLMTKFLLDMLIGAYTIDVPDGTAHWMREQAANGLVRAAVARQFRRMDSHAVYMRAAFGDAAVDRAEDVTTALPAAAPAAAIEPGPAPEPVPAVPSVPVPPVSQQAAPPVQPPAGPGVPPVSGPGVPPVSGQGVPPVPPVSQPPAQAAPPVAPPAGPPVSPIGTSIAATVRELLAQRPELADRANLPELLAEVIAVHGDSPTLAATVKKNVDRITNPRPRRKTS